jgi:hypothetical protein
MISFAQKYRYFLIHQVEKMQISLSQLRTKRQWRAITGLSEEQFTTLVFHVGNSYDTIFGMSITERISTSPHSATIQTYEDLLLFTLFSLKSGLTYDALGFACGMDGSNAKRNQQLGLQVLEHVLSTTGHLPKREFENAEAFKTYMSSHTEVLFDVTEFRIQRSSDYQDQKEDFSGKKKLIHQSQ